MTMVVREIEDIKDALKTDQQARHPYLRDYGEYSVLSTVNEATAIQVQYVEEQAKAAIEANSIWTATGNDLDLLVQDRGITRQEGICATGNLTFRTSTPVQNSAIVVPIGTLVSATGTDGTRLFFETTAAGTIDIGFTSIIIAAQAQLAGTDGNVPEYAINTMGVYIPGIIRVENAVAFASGTDEESDDDLRDRYIYAIDINGKATLPLIEQHIFDLDTVSECQVYNKAPGEVEIVVDTSVIDENDDDVVDCIEENIAAGVVGRGKVLATIVGGVITPNIDTIAAGYLFVRVESNLVTPNESFTIEYTDSVGIARTAAVTIPINSVKGDVVEATMYSPTSLVSAVTGHIYTGGNDYSILGGFGTYPYLYLIPKIVLINVQISILQTATPDPDLETKIEDSIHAFLDAYYIGDDLEFSDLVPYIYMDYTTKDTTRDQFVGIEQVMSVVISGNGSSINGFGQTIAINTDQRIEPGTVTITLT